MRSKIKDVFIEIKVSPYNGNMSSSLAIPS